MTRIVTIFEELRKQLATFHFRLESLLRIRITTRDTCRARLSQALQTERILKQQHTELIQQIDNLIEQQRITSQPGTISIKSLLEGHRYEIALRFRQKTLEQRYAQLKKEIEQHRQRLFEADRQVGVLEKLRERQRLKFCDNQNKKEAIYIADVASRSFKGIGHE